MFNKYIVFVFALNVFCSLECTVYTLSDHLNWECANNASCVKEVSSHILENLKQNRSITLGGISVDPIDTTQFSGRSFSLSGLMNGNRLKLPLGPVLMSVQRSKDHSDYIEVALLKKTNEGRGRTGGLGGGVGGGGGIGGGIAKDKKHLQLYIPMFLAMNAIGWMGLAMKAVSILTFKALIVSKLAFVIILSIIVKKFMDNAAERMIASHHFEHPEPIMMPYNMEYALPSHSYHSTSDLGASDLYSLHMSGGHEHVAPHSLEGLAAESSISHIVNLHNATQPQGLVGLQTVTKVKRQDKDMWAGLRRKPAFYLSRNPLQMYRQVNQVQ
ncbi:hypothetical protein Bhyg_10357 [Pseudolycoriella hygida]|uniref:Uncharacterized protein n=1 Tax=Pseudolycoriella hygida TaxID=35572 RepID=A0A9Q0MTD2_9DIPT|nr:hypothetical protein Bhyg_10357 [Pseudolycoriella hygida]